MPPIDQRERLVSDPFSHRVTKDGRMRISRGGRVVVTLSAKQADKLLAKIARDPDAEQLLLAKATGHYKHGNER